MQRQETAQCGSHTVLLIFESSQGWGSIACDKRCDAIIALDRNGRLWKSPSINQVVLLRVSGSHSCAILDSGKFKCWGNNLRRTRLWR